MSISWPKTSENGPTRFGPGPKIVGNQFGPNFQGSGTNYLEIGPKILGIGPRYSQIHKFSEISPMFWYMKHDLCFLEMGQSSLEIDRKISGIGPKF